NPGRPFQDRTRLIASININDRHHYWRGFRPLTTGLRCQSPSMGLPDRDNAGRLTINPVHRVCPTQAGPFRTGHG
ncbi:MAG: hypothetical protein P4L33_03310, partial [Capsulimonadaceae bacterium]|nr:hypothetical protein [Capsulimonadaceae bacterium]